MTRIPAVAGQFYPDDPRELLRMVQTWTASEHPRRTATGLMAPHAGYVYSGAIAGATFARVAVPQRVVILGPNHHGLGHPAAVYAEGEWRTPLGSVTIDAAFAATLLGACPELAADPLAHRLEHSLEVQVPFLQASNADVQIVPICLGRLSLEALLAIAAALAELVAADPMATLIVASSDMTHYEPGELAREKDLRAIEQLLNLDPQGLLATIRKDRTSMCGVLPATVLVAAARQLGCSETELVCYGNSGDVTGDQRSVVGYAGAIVWPPAGG